jgi:hypothetical protein
MRELIERGYIYIAQPPLYKIKRKKKERYVDNDAELNKILLELGEEDVTLVRAIDQHRFSKEDVAKIISAFSKIEMLGASVLRHGCPLPMYLDQHREDNSLPKYIVRIRSGNAEDYKFLLDAAFFAKHIDTLGKELYVYRTSNGSVTEKYKSNIHSDMAWINNWIRTNVCARYPEVEEGLDCCCAETYIVAMQNLCKADSPYNLQNRIKVAREIRKNNDYSRCIRVAGKQGKKISAKRRIIYYLLCMHCDAVYMFLYSIKRKSLFGAHEHEILAS